jgi:tetratricopeptide (TPR) repeat protein
VKLYNRIGNYHRIVGNAHQSIECFRRALLLEPHNSDVLINLARLLLKLKLHDDAIFLTRKSLEFIRADRSPWLQHFTLAEVLKANGYLDEAELHAEYTLKLKPNYSNGKRRLARGKSDLLRGGERSKKVHRFFFIPPLPLLFNL